jgi:hypothetical protein
MAMSPPEKSQTRKSNSSPRLMRALRRQCAEEFELERGVELTNMI